MALGMSLILPHLTNRRQQAGIPNWLKKKMDIFLPAPENVPLDVVPGHDLFLHPARSDSRRLCRQCLNNKTSRAEKNKLGKVYSQCQMCTEAICTNRMVMVCFMCKGNLTVTEPDREPEEHEVN